MKNFWVTALVYGVGLFVCLFIADAYTTSPSIPYSIGWCLGIVISQKK